MISTGLSDKEKESLLKYFLTNCSLEEQVLNGQTSYILHFGKGGYVIKDVGELVKKAILNIQNNVIMWGRCKLWLVLEKGVLNFFNFY